MPNELFRIETKNRREGKQHYERFQRTNDERCFAPSLHFFQRYNINFYFHDRKTSKFNFKMQT